MPGLNQKQLDFLPVFSKDVSTPIRESMSTREAHGLTASSSELLLFKHMAARFAISQAVWGYIATSQSDNIPP